MDRAWDVARIAEIKKYVQNFGSKTQAKETSLNT
jgi:hypothetical protein